MTRAYRVASISKSMVFGKLYRRSFLDKFDIRMNMSHSNEDTGYNCVVKGLTNRIWYIPKPIYMWRYKGNSITRINGGMYGQDSGLKGYIDNMIWQIKELKKRYVNKNYILEEILSIMCVIYYFYIENMYNYPLNIETCMNWCRGYYEEVYKDIEDNIPDGLLGRIFANVTSGQRIFQQGLIPKITFDQFMDKIRSKPCDRNNDMDTVGGASPAGHTPEITPENYPVEIHEYLDNIIMPPNIDTNTNLSRMDGMNRVLDKAKQERLSSTDKLVKDNVPVTSYQSGLSQIAYCDTTETGEISKTVSDTNSCADPKEVHENVQKGDKKPSELPHFDFGSHK